MEKKTKTNELPEHPDVVYCRPLRSGNRKQLACVRKDSPLIEERKGGKMEYVKYVRADNV